MIVQWKRLGPMEYRAVWQGKRLCLEYNPTEHRWRLHVDLARVRQRWPSPVAAFDAVETVLNKIIQEQMSIQAQLTALTRPFRRPTSAQTS